MGFSRGQQPEFRRLEKAAWALHCRRGGLDPRDKAAYDAWYRGELEKATGKRSTTACNPGRHYERACAHFEDLAEDGIKHQLRLIQGDLKRIRYAAAQINPEWLRQFAADADLDRYLRAIASQAFKSEIELHRLDDRQIHIVTQAVRIDANRGKAA